MKLRNLVIGKQFKLLAPEILKNRIRYVSTTQGVSHQKETVDNSSFEDDQFRVIELTKKKLERRPWRSLNEAFFKQPREKTQSVTQDWGNVWPGNRSFHPASVPLPVRMGYPHKSSPYPDKWGNAELMKIPNFLHITPPVIERQCAAIKKFCTPWPKELATEEAQDFHFPVTVKTSSYLYSSPSLRDPRSRIVTLRINIENLDLDWHALDKLLRLVGDRFDTKTKILTLVADRCPLSSQNLEYCKYLLTVLYNESRKTEPWEHERDLDLDGEHFSFDSSSSRVAVADIEETRGSPLPAEVFEEYDSVVTRIHNEGEDMKSVTDYKNAVLKVLNLA